MLAEPHIGLRGTYHAPPRYQGRAHEPAAPSPISKGLDPIEARQLLGDLTGGGELSPNAPRTAGDLPHDALSGWLLVHHMTTAINRPAPEATGVGNSTTVHQKVLYVVEEPHNQLIAPIAEVEGHTAQQDLEVPRRPAGRQAPFRNLGTPLPCPCSVG